MDFKSGYNKLFVHEINKITSREKASGVLSVEGLSADDFDIVKYSEKFYNSDNNANASIDDNANLGKHKTSNSFANGAYKSYTKLHSYYLLWDKLRTEFGIDTANEALESTVSGDIYIHDATNMTIPYCFNYTCYDIVLNGLPDWSGIADISAPTTMMSYINQIKNFLVSASSQQMGATGIADFLVFFAWYVQRVLEGVSDENGELIASDYNKLEDGKLVFDKELFEQRVWGHAKRQIRSFIYDLNFKYKGDQSLFTNVSIYDNYFLDSMLNDIDMPGECKKINKDVVNQVQSLYADIYESILTKTIITYPVTTACYSVYDEVDVTINDSIKLSEADDVMKIINSGLFKNDKLINAADIKIDNVIKINGEEIKVTKIHKIKHREHIIKDEDFLDMIAEKNIDKQWCNSYHGKTSQMSSCCRLRSDMDDFEEEFNSVTGSGSAKIGSLGVATINMPRIGYLSKRGDIASVNTRIEELTELTIRINFAKRLMISESIERGMLPIYTDGYMDLNKQYSTTGIIGVYEFADTLGYDITSDEGIAFVVDAINKINEVQDKFAKMEKFAGIKYNIEQVPGESASVKLAEKDKLKGYNTSYEIYSNQFIPLKLRVDLIERVRVSGTFDTLMSGGSIVHIGMDKQIKCKEDYKDLTRMIAAYGVKTWAINHTLGKCKKCSGVDVYEKDNYVCPRCGGNHIVLHERIVGYLVETESFSKVKKTADFDNRHYY